MENSDKVRIMSHFSPGHETSVVLYLVLHFSAQRCGSVEKSNKVRIMSHFSPGDETSVVLYLVVHFSKVWKCGKV